jgi:hypothetical protein
MVIKEEWEEVWMEQLWRVFWPRHCSASYNVITCKQTKTTSGVHTLTSCTWPQTFFVESDEEGNFIWTLWFFCLLLILTLHYQESLE